MLTQKQIRAIPFLLAGDPLEIVARKARVSTRSLSGWLADDEFCEVLSEYLDDRISEAVQQTGNKLAAAADEAVSELVRMMKDSKQYPELHLKIITTVLDRLQRISEYRRPRRVV